MRIAIGNDASIEVRESDDLLCLVPADSVGRVLNYGQGEGQVWIDGIVWGLYVDSSGHYYLQFEEGSLRWEEFDGRVSRILSHLQSTYGASTILVKGMHEHASAT